MRWLRDRKLVKDTESQDPVVDPRRLLVVFAIIVFTLIWLVQSILTRDFWLKNLFRPYLPGWALLVNAFTAPLTMALVGLRTIPWKATIALSFIMLLQASLFGLVGERYPWVQGGVTLFGYFEAYLLLTRLNRYIEDRNLPKDGTLLDLK